MIHISNIYVCAEINTVSELYYIAEIAKYLKILENETLSMEGVIIKPTYLNSKYYRYMQSQSIEGIPFREFEQSRDIFTGDLLERDIVFAEKSNTEWIFDYDGKGTNPYNSLIFKGLLANQVYVSFMALLTVKKILYGNPKTLLLDFVNANICFTKNFDNWDILDIWLIYKKTKAFETWVTIKLPEVKRAEAQLRYEAYVREHELVGGMLETSSVKQKIDCFRKRFRKGDIVLLYTKSVKGNKNDNVRTVESCTMARVEKATSQRIELTAIYTTETPLSTKKRIDELPEKNRELYGDDYYLRHHEQKMSLDWLDVGICEYTYIEEYFITDLNCDDSVELWFNRKDGTEVKLELQNADAIYAILCERKIEFDKQRFEKLYFSKVPSTYKREILEIQ